MIKYPANIDDNTVLPVVSNSTTVITGDILNNLRDAIVRIQKELGVKPSRIYTNVKTRLDEIDKIIKLMSGGDLLRVSGMPMRGQTIIWNGSAWVPDTNFLSEKLTTTSNFKVGRSIATSASAGILTISGKLVLNKIKQPAVSNIGDGIIYFDEDTGLFMVSENAGPYIPLNIGSAAVVTAAFNASLDLSGDRLSQTVIGLRGNKVYFSDNHPKDGEPLNFNAADSSWNAGTNFGSNVISTAGNFKTKTITVSDLGATPGILHTDNTGKIFSRNIIDADVDSAAAVKGIKINPEFGYQNITTQKSISAQEAKIRRLYLGSPNSFGLMTSASTWPFLQDPDPDAKDGTIHIGIDGYISVKRGDSWSLLPAEPTGYAGADLYGTYPQNISVVGIKGATVASFGLASSLKDGYAIKASGPSSLSFSSVPLDSTDSVIGVLPRNNQESQSLLGDLVGTTSNAIVAGICGIQVSSANPTDGYFLAYNQAAQKFVPTDQSTITSNLPVGGTSGEDLYGTYPNPTVKKIQGLSVQSGQLVDGYIFQVIGQDPAAADYLGFAPIDLSDENIAGSLPDSRQMSQIMGGPDVIGSTKGATVIKINGMDVDAAPPSDGYCLVYDKITNPSKPRWAPKSIAIGGRPNVPVNGNGSGDLSGSYPEPTVVKINGASAPQMPVSAGPGNLLLVGSSTNRSLRYGSIDLSDPNNILSFRLPASLQESQSLLGDVTGKTDNSRVEKIQGVAVDTALSGKDGYFMRYDSSAQQFNLYVPRMEELDGYASISANIKPAGSLENGKIYFDPTSNKLRVVEGMGDAKDVLISSYEKPLNIVPISLPSTLDALSQHTATALPGGKILIVGGTTDGTNAIDSVYSYDMSNGDLQLKTKLKYGKRKGHTATLTKRYGKDVIVIIGGTDGTVTLGSTEYYDVESETIGEDINYPDSTFKLNGGMQKHTATRLKNDSILICGGENYANGTGPATYDAYIYEPGYGIKKITSTFGYTQTYPDSLDTLQSKSYQFNGSLNFARKNHTATLIDGGVLDGYVLVVGGVTGGTGTSSQIVAYSEVYDPNTQFFYSYAQPPKYDGCASVVLDDGSILYTGGWNGSSCVTDCYIYNPNTNLFRKACPLNEPRAFHTITRKTNDSDTETYYIIGGRGSSTININNVSGLLLKTAESYVVNKNTNHTNSNIIFYWENGLAKTSYITSPRYRHTTTFFTKNGSPYFLICGGFGPAISANPLPIVQNSDILIGSTDVFFKLDRPMLYPRADHTATLLQGSNKIMICGGSGNQSVYSSYYTYNTSSYPITPNGMPSEFKSFPSTATDYTYPTAPWSYGNISPLSTVEYFDISNLDTSNATIVSGQRTIIGNLFGTYTLPAKLDNDSIDNTGISYLFGTNKFSHLKLRSGKILISGGFSIPKSTLLKKQPSSACYIFDPTTKLFYRTGDMQFAAVGHTLTELPNGKVISIGGLDSNWDLYAPSSLTYGTYKTQIFDPVSHLWSAGPDTKDSTRFAFHTAVPISGYNNDPNRFVIIIMGGLAPASIGNYVNPSSSVQQCEFKSDGSLFFLRLTSLAQARFFHTASLLPDKKKILVVGGGYGNQDNIAQYGSLYLDSSSSAAITTGKLTSTAEIYDIGTNTNGVTTVINTISPRVCHTATPLSDGRVVISGGGNAVNNYKTVEIYNGTAFAASQDMANPMFLHSATAIQGNKILFSGRGKIEIYDPTSSAASISINNGFIHYNTCSYVSDTDSNSVITIPSQSDGQNTILPCITYDVTTNTTTSMGSWMNERKSGHNIFDIGNNKFMIIGGISNINDVSGIRRDYLGTVDEYQTFFSPSKIKEIYNATDGKFTNANYITDSGYGILDFGSCVVNSDIQGADNFVFLSGGQVHSTGSRTQSGGTTVISAAGTKTYPIYTTEIRLTPNPNSYLYSSNVAVKYDLVIASPNKKTKTNVFKGNNGDAVVMGGYDSSGTIHPYVTSAANYNPGIDRYNFKKTSWSTPGALNLPRAFFTSSALEDGYVLIAGGSTSPTTTSPTNTTEVFNSNTSSFAYHKSMNSYRAYHTATTLAKQPDGTRPILVSGGSASSTNIAIASSEFYPGKYYPSYPTNQNTIINWGFDDLSATISSTGTLLKSNLVNAQKNDGTLGSIASLQGLVGSSQYPQLSTDAIYGLSLFNTNTTAAICSYPNSILTNSSYAPECTDIGNGKTIIVDGINKNIDIFDGYTGQITKVSDLMSVKRSSTNQKYSNVFTITLLKDKNRVLIVGGDDNSGTVRNSAEIFNITTRKFEQGTTLNFPRAAHTATLLSTAPYDGYVLICGGYNDTSDQLSAAELYDPVNNKFILAGNELSVPRAAHTATKLNDGRVVVIGGYTNSDPISVPTDTATVVNWKFEEPAGSTTFVNSASSTSVNLTKYGSGTASGSYGKFGRCISFNGAQGNYLASASVSGIPNTTVSVWIYLNSYTSTNIITRSYDSTGTLTNGGGFFYLRLNSSGYVYTQPAGSPASSLQSLNPIPLKTWTLISSTISSSSLGLQLRLYVNGKINSTSSWYTIPISTTGVWYVGGHQYTDTSINGSVNGKIDDIRLENTTRNEAYLLDMYTKGITDCTASCEQYDPITNMFYAAGSISKRRHSHTSKIISGNINIFGGSTKYPGTNTLSPPEYIPKEIYVPPTNTGLSGTLTTITNPESIYALNSSSVLSSDNKFLVFNGMPDLTNRYFISANENTIVNWKLNETSFPCLNSTATPNIPSLLAPGTSPTLAQVGIDGNCASFPGGDSNSYLLTASSYKPSFTNNFTISLWVYLKSYPASGAGSANIIATCATQTSLDSGGASPQPLWVYMDIATGNLCLKHLTTTNVSNVKLPLNKWTFISVTYDTSSLKLYSDWNLVTTINNASFTNWGGGFWAIGGFKSPIQSINGLIDDVRIENTIRNKPSTMYCFNADLNSYSTIGGTTYVDRKIPKSTTINAAGSVYDGYVAIFGESKVVDIYDPKTNTITTVNQPDKIRSTVSLWAKATAFPTSPSTSSLVFKNFFDNGNQSSPYNGGIAIDIDGGGYVIVRVTSGGRVSSTITSNSAVTLNKWNHIAITIDTSIQANNANIYINGSIDKTFSVSGYLDWGGGRWNIGSSYVFNNKFSGYIDDVKVENYVASPSNILAMYGAAAYNTWAQTDSMVYGRIDHTSTTLLDSAGNATSDAAIVGGKGITYIALQPALLMMFKPEKYSHYYSRYNQISQKIIISGSYTALNTDGNIIFVDPSHSSPKRFKYNLTLPSASSCKDGQVITASISPYLASSDYTIKVAAQNNDAINGANVSLELKKSSVTFILDSSTNPPTWWQIDSGS